MDDLFAIPPSPPASGHTPTIWCGMALGPWLALLARNRFAVSSRHWGRALSATLAAPFNSLWGAIAQAVHGFRLRRVEIRQPLFSPYEVMAFPRARRGMDCVDPGQLEPRTRRRFERRMRRFLAGVLLPQRQRRLLLKSPVHMARLRFLSELFPDLKVIHIVRVPTRS